MIDEKLSGEEIHELCAEHFPNRHNDIKSKALCEVFRLIVERRAAANARDEESTLREVQWVLIDPGIPREQFYQVEKETEDV